MQSTIARRTSEVKDSSNKSVIKRPGITDRPVRFRCFLNNTIYEVLKNRGWQEVAEGSTDWDFNWCDVGSVKENFDHMYLQEHMRINHFRNHYELTKKNLVIKNLRRMRKQIEREKGKDAGLGSSIIDNNWDFFPTSYELPSEYHMFVEEFKRAPPGAVWIMKPAGRAQGKGIFLFRQLKQIMDWKKVANAGGGSSGGTSGGSSSGATGTDAPGITTSSSGDPMIETYVVQRYLDNPYLINGRKFDLRVYCLVTSYNPLRVWVYREGFARLTNTRFTLDSLDDTYVHLTNVAVQKTAPDYDPDRGAKWSMQRLREYLTAKHGWQAVRELLKQIDGIFLKSLLSVQKLIIHDKHCFEMYGYDVLIDNTLKPWLIEINASPSLTASSKEDYEMKCRLLDDMASVIDMEGRLSGKERRVGSFDLIHDEKGIVGLEEVGIDVVPQSQYNINSFLGGDTSDRKVALRRAYREARVSILKEQSKSTTNTAATNQQQQQQTSSDKVPLSMTHSTPS